MTMTATTIASRRMNTRQPRSPPLHIETIIPHRRNTSITRTRQRSTSCPIRLTPARDENVEEILSSAVLQEPHLLNSLERPSFYVALSPSTRANSYRLLASHVYANNDAKKDRLSTEDMNGGRGDGYEKEFYGVDPFESHIKRLAITPRHEPGAKAHIDNVAAAEETQWEEKLVKTVCYLGDAADSEKAEMNNVAKMLG
ncbi:hypothetical protein BDZ89DRAFT_1050159 [Hymenopellis radicata]|nr:hypothetical protein BDZ89DRAFT_1050159 [Hymenopellis radicata]